MEQSFLQIETLRCRVLALFKKSCWIALAVTIIFSLILIPQENSIFSFALAAIIGIGAGFLAAYLMGFFRASKEYARQFKAAFVEIPMNHTFSHVFYDGEKGLNQDLIRHTGIMALGNIYHSNDYVSGSYRDVHFTRADVIIQQHVSTGKTSYTVTYLNGRWLIFDFNKNFHFDLQIIDKDFIASQKKNSIFTESNERRHRIKLEDMEFNELFQVYCQDDHEAYYILTPQFMAVLKELKETLGGALMLGFIDNQLHVAIHTNKDAMEPKLFEKPDFNRIQQEVQGEIDVIINIIDSLELDRDLYCKASRSSQTACASEFRGE